MAMALFLKVDPQWDITLWKLVKKAAWLAGEKPPSCETQPPLDARIPLAIILFYRGSRKVSRGWDLTTVRQLLAGLTEPVLLSACCTLGRFRHVQLCATLWTVGPPGSSVHGIFQARTLEWVAVPSCSGSSWCRDWSCVSYVSHIGRQLLYH